MSADLSNKKVLIIIPAFNEQESIARIVAEVAAADTAFSILVVDDGSQDGTSLAARTTLAMVMTLPFNLGVGGAVQTGLLYAKRQGYDLAVQVDGDGQHDAKFLADVLRPLFTGQADISIGSRFIAPFLGYRSSLVRRIGIHFFAFLISALTGFKVTDPTSGFRAFNKKAIDFFAEDYPTDYPEPESIVMAKRYGMTLVEVPVQMRERLHGHSSIRYLRTLYYMFKVTLAILLDMIKRKGR